MEEGAGRWGVGPSGAGAVLGRGPTAEGDMCKGDVSEEDDATAESGRAQYLPGLAGEVEGEGVLGAVVWERVREGEKGEAVVWGEPVTGACGVRVCEVGPCVDGSAAEAM